MSVYVLALLVAALLACGTYLILSQHAVKLILGLGLLSHAFNLVIFGTTRLTAGQEPILDKTLLNQPGYPDPAAFADPLPHALILTAIVISFGLTAYLVALVQRLHEVERPAASNADASDASPASYQPYRSVERFAPGKDAEPVDFLWLEWEARASETPPPASR